MLLWSMSSFIPHRSTCCIFAFADFLQHFSCLAKLTVTKFKLNYKDQEQHEFRKKPLSFRRTHILIRPVKKYFNLSVWTLIFLLITGKRPLCLKFQVNIFEISFPERESWFLCVCDENWSCMPLTGRISGEKHQPFYLPSASSKATRIWRRAQLGILLQIISYLTRRYLIKT